MFYDKKILGAIGEEHAVYFLKKKGYKIIQRNFRANGGEIDIIAIDQSQGKDEETLCFIEVKTRTTRNFGDPFEAIGYYKMRALTRTAQYYKSIHRSLPDLLRIDAVLIIIDDHNQIKEIELVKNISY